MVIRRGLLFIILFADALRIGEGFKMKAPFNNNLPLKPETL
jgi:hypothetical protein